MLTTNELLYYGAAFSQLHKNEVFIALLKKSFVISIERSFFG